MTSLLDTTHFHSATLSQSGRSNTPVCRNPQITYAPSHVSSRIEDGTFVVVGRWNNGMSGEYMCAPVTVTVTYDGDAVIIDPVRSDDSLGVEDPVRLKPSMASGFVVALTEHFEELVSHQPGLEDLIGYDPKLLPLAVSRNLHRYVDARHPEPLAPCVVPPLETQVQLSHRTLAFTGR